jgi:predicted ATPase
MGFGFSQMLPIAAQLWAASEARKGSQPIRRKMVRPLVVIEQPELHLHPDYQARLADIFVAAVGEQGRETNPNQPGLRVIAETHSPALINRLGMLVAEGILHKDCVQIVVFDQKDTNLPSKIRIAEFDSEGVLQNWPFGFFEPSSMD